MDKKNMHGRVFKKLREERGYKSKDVAGDVISTRTLTRFEADETSLSISTFEKLLENCGVLPLDYLTYYYDNTETETTEFLRRIQKQLESGFVTKVINECKKELKKKNIDFVRRLDVLIILLSLTNKDDSKLFEENKRIIKEKIESMNKLGWNELIGLINLMYLASREDFTVEYIDRNIKVCLHNISTINYLSKSICIIYCQLLSALLSFLSRNGYYSLAEKRCKEVLNFLEKHPLLFNVQDYYFVFIRILATIYLRQNKIEGVELANRVLKYYNMVVEITDAPYAKATTDFAYKAFCKVNKTGIDFEF